MKPTMRNFTALALCLALCLCLGPAAFADGGLFAESGRRWPSPPAASARGGFAPVSSDAAAASTYDSYNATSAASYALQWWSSFNPDWYNWEAEGYGDCTNFVSQCLYAGGMPMSADWYWISRGNYVDSWTMPNKLAMHLVRQGYSFVMMPTAAQISLGDVLFYDWDQNGLFDHAAICVSDSGNTRYICAHSNPQCTPNWTLGGASYMVVQLHGARGTVYPGKPVLTGMREAYELGKPVTFTWDPTENTSYYKLLLGKKSASGSYELVEQYQNVQSGFQLTLEAGEYGVLLKAYNINSRMPDGSDYANSTSDAVYFSVNAASFTVAYDANGGAGAPGAQTKARGVALTLSTALPTRERFWFLGWAESKDAAAAAYLPGGSYTKDASATLYAVWAQPDFVLPQALTAVGEEAFADCAFRFAALSEKTEEIGRLAFARCENLKYIFIPRSCVRIDETAFDGVTGLTVIGAPGSCAHTFAQQKGYAFLPVN